MTANVARAKPKRRFFLIVTSIQRSPGLAREEEAVEQQLCRSTGVLDNRFDSPQGHPIWGTRPMDGGARPGPEAAVPPPPVTLRPIAIRTSTLLDWEQRLLTPPTTASLHHRSSSRPELSSWLNTPGTRLTDARWINCQGNIAAEGYDTQVNIPHSHLLIRQGARAPVRSEVDALTYGTHSMRPVSDPTSTLMFRIARLMQCNQTPQCVIRSR